MDFRALEEQTGWDVAVMPSMTIKIKTLNLRANVDDKSHCCEDFMDIQNMTAMA